MEFTRWGYEITISIRESTSGRDDADRRFWDVDIIRSDQLVTRCRLQSPLETSDSAEELRWYLEDFTSDYGSPFEDDRAKSCRQTLRSYGECLHSSLNLSLVETDEAAALVLDIVARSPQSGFHTIHWEILEDPGLWKHVRDVVIRRKLEYPRRQSFALSRISSPTLNILLVTSRPSLSQDVAYRKVAVELVRTIATLPQDACAVRIECVRPGTWPAVQRHLTTFSDGTSCPQAFFHIVHLDVHGRILDRNGRKAPYLDFLKASGTGTFHQKAATAASTFAERGVKAVFMNACKSASSISMESNLVETFITSGITMVVGMSHNIHNTAAAIFVGLFYKHFLEARQPWHVAAWQARKKLRTEQTRTARFGVSVEVDDWIVPSFYFADVYDFHTPSLDNGACCPGITKRSAIMATETVEIVKNAVHPAMQKFNEGHDVLGVDHREIIGRDSDILALETALTLPLKVDGFYHSRRIVYLHGTGGIGKTHLVKHLVWWWRITGLVEESFYFTFDQEQCPTLNSMLCDIVKKGDMRRPPAGVDLLTKAFELLQTRRHLVVLDHLDALKLPNRNLAQRERQAILKFVISLRFGQSFIILISRNEIEDWLFIPHGQMWSYRVSSLSSQSARELATDTHSKALGPDVSLIRKYEDQQTLQTYLEDCDYNAAAITHTMSLLKAHGASVDQIEEVIRKGFPDDPGIRYLPSRMILNCIEVFLRLLADHRNRSVSSASYTRLELLRCYALFRRRLPVEHVSFFVYRAVKLDEGTVFDLHNCWNSDQWEVFRTMSNHEISIFPLFAPFLIPGIRATQGMLFEELLRYHLCQVEYLPTESEKIAYYWLHPCLKLLILKTIDLFETTEGEIAPESSLGALGKAAFSEFWDRRMQEFEDGSLSKAQASQLRIEWELENIVLALDLWTSTKEAETRTSEIVRVLGQFAKTTSLENREYRAVLNCLERFTSNYKALINSTAERQWAVLQLDTFLIAASVLQNTYFAINEWTLCRKYKKIIMSAIKANPETSTRSSLAVYNSSLCKMISACDLHDQGHLHSAERAFRDNLKMDCVSNASPIDAVHFAKLRWYNLAGLEMCVSGNPNVSSAALQRLSKQTLDAFEECERLHSEIDIGHAFFEKSSFIKKLYTLTQEARDFNEAQAMSEKPSVEQDQNALDWFTRFVEVAAPSRQNIFSTLSKALTRKDAFDSKKGRMEALLHGLSDSIKSNSGCDSQAQYYQNLSVVQICEQNWAPALSYHRKWSEMRQKQNMGEDAQAKAQENYLNALYYMGLKNYDEARRYASAAINYCETAKDDNLLYACYMGLSAVEAETGPNWLQSLRWLFKAGVLAYDESCECDIHKPGEIGMRLADIISLILTNEDAMNQVLKSEEAMAAPEINTQNYSHLQKDPLSRPFLVLQCVSLVAAQVIGPARMLSFLQGISTFRFEADENGQCDEAWHHLEELLFKIAEPTVSENGDVGACEERTSNDCSKGNVSDVSPRNLIPSGHESVYIEHLFRISSALLDQKGNTLLHHICARLPNVGGIASNVLEAVHQIHNFEDTIKASLYRDIFGYCFKAKVELDGQNEDGDTAFILAIKHQNHTAAQALADNAASMHVANFSSETALHIALENGGESMIRLCIANGSDLALKTEDGETPLAVALRRGNPHHINLLLNAGANVLATDNTGESCLIAALHTKNALIFKACCEVLSKFDRELLVSALWDHGWHGISAMETAFTNRLPEEINTMLGKLMHTKDSIRPNRLGCTPFHRGAQYAPPHILKPLFLQAGHDPNIKDRCLGWNVCHYAAFNKPNAEPMLDLLSKYGGDLKAQDSFGWTPLDYFSHLMSVDTKVNEVECPKLHASFRHNLAKYRQYMRAIFPTHYSDEERENIRTIRRHLHFPHYVTIFSLAEQTLQGIEALDEAQINQAVNGALDARKKAIDEGKGPFVVHDTPFGADYQDLCQMMIDRWPHVFYVGPTGTIKATHRATDLEMAVPRVWIADGAGIVYGVLGAFLWPG